MRSVICFRRVFFVPAGQAAAALLLGSAATLLLGSAEARAGATIRVDPGAASTDDGKCSLEEAIKAANTDKQVDACESGAGDDVIMFEAPGEIRAQTDVYRIESNMTIQGHADGTTIRGRGGFRIIMSTAEIAQATDVTLAHLTVTGSDGPGVHIEDDGGKKLKARITVALRNLHLHGNQIGARFDRDANSGRAGAVRIENTVISGNSENGIRLDACDLGEPDATLWVANSVVRGNGDYDIEGGGIYNRCGNLKVVDSTISGNSANFGGGIYASGGKSREAITHTELVNSTIADNRAWGRGGGVFVSAFNTNPVLTISHNTIVNNTIVNNTAPGAGIGGVHTQMVEADSGTVVVNIANSVIAGNTGEAQCKFESSRVGGNHNASSDASCGFGLVEAGFGLGKLSDNGGARLIGPRGDMGNVLTRAIDRSSALFNAGGEAKCRERDARGVARPQNGGCDIGAYEANYVEIGGSVWSDGDADGERDSGDGPHQRVTLDLRDEQGDATASETTDADGEYRFEVLLPGEWTVVVTDRHRVLAGHRAITRVSARRVLGPAASSALDVDFRYQQLAQFGGAVWVDSDGDGVRGEGERGREGVQVRLRQGGSGFGSAWTGENGGYRFSGLVPGAYQVEVERPGGFLFTVRKAGGDSDVDPSSGRTATFVLGPGVNRVPRDAGLVAEAPAATLAVTADAESPVGEGAVVSYLFVVTNTGNVTLTQVSVYAPKVGDVDCPRTTLAPEKAMTCMARYTATPSDVAAGRIVNTATVSAKAPNGANVTATGSVSTRTVNTPSGGSPSGDSPSGDSPSGDSPSGGSPSGGSPSLPGSRPPARPSGAPERLQGKDRYSTAVEISKTTFDPGVDVVYVATGEDFPDALVGSAASGGNGPILFVTRDAIPTVTAAELRRLKPKRVVVLGGTGVVSASVEAKLGAYAKTTRQAGPDRYSTAAAVSVAHFKPGAPVAFVATGEDFPDALTGGPAAAKLGGPILLTRRDKLPPATVSELRRLKPKRIVVLGGKGVVSASVQSALGAHTSRDATRLAGADRYETGAAISKDTFDPGAPVAYIATGLNFPDALAGGAAGAFDDGPMLLVAGGIIPKATKDELTRLKPSRIIVLGGTAVIPESVEKALAAYLPKAP